MPNNIFLTGAPGVGKTTVIQKIIKQLGLKATGFYTQELREKGKRLGFKIITLHGKEDVLAHVNIKSPYKVSRYYVSVENIDCIAVPSITSDDKEAIIVIDEIGKMECFSDKFRRAALRALDSQNLVLGTISVADIDFIRSIRQRPDIEIHGITRSNRNILPEKIIATIKNHLL